MDFGKWLGIATGFFQSHPYIGGAVALALVVLIYLRTKVMLKLMAAAAIIIAVLYVGAFLIDLTQTGIQEQSKFLDKPHINMKDL